MDVGLSGRSGRDILLRSLRQGPRRLVIDHRRAHARDRDVIIPSVVVFPARFRRPPDKSNGRLLFPFLFSLFRIPFPF